MKLELNEAEVAVLLRCIDYGATAVSSNEWKNGIGKVIREVATPIRKKLSSSLANGVISKLVEKQEEAK